MRLMSESEIVSCKFGAPRCGDGDDRDDVAVTWVELRARVVEVVFEDDDSGREDACDGPGSEVGPGIVGGFEGCVEG